MSTEDHTQLCNGRSALSVLSFVLSLRCVPSHNSRVMWQKASRNRPSITNINRKVKSNGYKQFPDVISIISYQSQFLCCSYTYTRLSVQDYCCRLRRTGLNTEFIIIIISLLNYLLTYLLT